MEEAPENGKELLHSVHANGMSEYFDISKYGQHCVLNMLFWVLYLLNSAVL